MRNVLPPRLDGPLALVEEAMKVDIVFCAHHGLDGLARVADAWSGDLVGGRIIVRFWRCARDEIPATREELVDWLLDEWQRVDDWVGIAAGAAELGRQTVVVPAP